MIARIMKPCIVIVLDKLYKHLDPVSLTYISRLIYFVIILRQVKFYSVFLCTYDS